MFVRSRSQGSVASQGLGIRLPAFGERFRRDLERLRQPRRLLAILIIGVVGGAMVALLLPRGELAGADARAYWAGVRIWLAGGDPYHPLQPLMPYPYAPWLLPAFAPWALLPWDVAWFVWRGANVLLFAWSVGWAYSRRPLLTAVLLLLLSPWIAATLDTGNITLLLALAVWGAQFVGPRLGGTIWALTVMTKWFPAVLFLFLRPRTRFWGLVALAVSLVFSLATLPATVTWIQAMVSYPRPLRVDYVLLLWAAIPWLYRLDWRHARAEATAATRRPLGDTLRSFLGVS